MKILHLADLHFCRDRADEALTSMNAALFAAIRHDVDLIAIAGDTWDGPVQNTAGSRFPEFIAAIAELASRAPVAMIYGTPTHDVDGSLQVFEELKTEYGVTILRPGVAYGIKDGEIRLLNDESEAILFGIPEPNKKWLLADESAGAIGKDTADEAVRASMRNLFLGLGGLRKQNPHIPCLTLYHGQVAGAKTSTGYTADSAIAVTRDDLAAIGADYIACGDIHLPQQIFDLPAYYSGSIYPANFGETHQVGCNLVVMEPGTTSIQRIEFPHPRRMKVSLRAGDTLSLPVSGCVVWQEITCTREEAAKIDTTKLTEALISSGAVPGSRVTLNILPTETVRAGDIVSRKSLRAKVQIWGENSSLALPESVFRKADQLESEAIHSGRAVTGSRIRIDKLILRGAIGLWEVSRKDEIVLDLESIGPGVLALAGENGAGKTTILENMHPYPQMLTRSGPLKSHFRLRDSCRDLYFSDPATGTRYRALIQINGATASGGAEYFLFKDTGSGFEPVPGVVGRLEAYEAEIARIFGPLSLYLKTAFVTQRPSKDSPDLADATKGDRKTLFADLAGIDYLSAYAADAKGRADTLERIVQDRSILLATMDSLPSDKERATKDLIDSRDKKTMLDDDLAKVVMAGQKTRAKLETLRAAIAERREAIIKRSVLSDSINTLIREKQAATTEQNYWQQASTLGPHAEAELQRADALSASISIMEQERSALSESFNRAMIEHRMQFQNYQKDLAAIQYTITTLQRSKASLQGKADAITERLNAPIKDTCPTCGQSLPPAALREVESKRAKDASDLEEMLRNIAAISQRIESEKAGEKACTAPQAPESVPYLKESELADLKKALSAIDIQKERKIRDASLQANSMIQSIASRIESLNDRIKTSESELAVFDADFSVRFAQDPTSEYAMVNAEYENLRTDHSRISVQIGSVMELIKASERRIQEIDAALIKRVELTKLQAIDSAELSDWQILTQACGKDGVQALELDALAPSISEIANRLLESAYGSRYRIEFRTTRIAGKGSKTKQVEDFLIYIINQETGTEKELSFLSGGESVWIKRAIYDAFSTIRARNSGLEFLTVFQDEADGALDPSARMAYLRMLEAAHKEAGRFQTLLISHSTEIQAMVERVINVASLTGRTV